MDSPVLVVVMAAAPARARFAGGKAAAVATIAAGFRNMTVLADTKLGAWLRREKPEYFYKAQELRDTVTGWLGYIVETFPHYTRHTVDHSDEIVLQMSHLLFGDKKKPVVALSPIEAYVLMAAAYLHDAGMVVPDDEKRSILESDEWKRWVSGAARERWEKVQTIRTAASPPDAAVRHFLADLYTRHLIAEFVRRVHHKRAGRVIAEHPATFDQFAFNDSRVARTIADVCIGHGLSHSELKDPGRYPEQRQLAGDTANVRWMAMMLRLGDLLDMRSDRACPLLLNAAAPLPPESVVHWSQYEKLTHFLVTTKRIEISAECDTRDEYQVLRDWTHWIEEEANNATLAMTHADRHSEWKPPLPKIRIDKSPTATFLIDDWKFELDRDAVFDRLIHDVYDDPITFIRELIQNALDATRVQMYLDLDADGLPRPDYPTLIDEARRERYPVEVALEDRGDRQFFTITDRGVGMDRDIISRYLLQIGRSYYVSDEFQRAFRFVPTSRFGVGFLSVFAVADEVTIDTFKPTSKAQDGPIQLVLRGVRNYVLPQVGSRRERGTRIEVLLRQPIAASDAVEAIVDWCRRVEVPVLVRTSEGTKVLRRETAEEFESHVPDVETPGAEWHVRAYPFQDKGVEGEIYIESRSHNGVEELGDSRYDYNDKHLLHQLPHTPLDLSCFHGISMDVRDRRRRSWSYRIDIRRPSSISLSRRNRDGGSLLPEVRQALVAVLRSYVDQCPSACGPQAWRYLQRLSARFDEVWEELWQHIPMIPAATARGRILAPIEVAAELEIVTGITPTTPEDESSPPFADTPRLAFEDEHVRAAIIARRQPLAVHIGNDVAVKWGPVDGGEPDAVFRYGLGVTMKFLPMPSRVAMVELSSYRFAINQDHPLADWVRAVQRAVESEKLSKFRAGGFFGGLGMSAALGRPPDVSSWRGDSVPAELRVPPLVQMMRGVLGSPEGEQAG